MKSATLDRFPDFCIYGTVKTTLEIPDDIYRALKMRSARDGVTVTKLVSSALALSLGRTGSPVDDGRPPKDEDKKLAAWRQKESSFLRSMRGPVFGDQAVDDLLGGRR